MLFDKNIEPSCSYCQNGVRLSETEVGCVRRGVVSAAGACRRFRYDPLKRDPPGALPLPAGRFREEDFIL